MIQILYLTKIDFNELEAWRDTERDDIPPTNFIAIYRALGIVDQILEYKKDHPDFEPIPLDNIACNTSTLRRLKSFLEEMWSTYSLNIDADEHIFWDTKKWPKGKKHYAKKIKKTIMASLYDDFRDHCPGIDDELNVNEICFRIYVPDPEPKEMAAEA